LTFGGEVVVPGKVDPGPLLEVRDAGSISDVEKKNGEESCPVGECGMSAS